MKNYMNYAVKIGAMERFSDIHNCGYPVEHFPVNLYFELARNPGCRMFVAYDFGSWQIQYTTDSNVKYRRDMKSTGRIKTDRDMYTKVKEIVAILSNAAQ